MTLQRRTLVHSTKQMKPAMKRGKPLVQRAFPVTDPVDAPDGAVVDGFVRGGDHQLKRSSGLKRSAFKRKPPRPNPAGDFPAHRRLISSMDCVACGRPGPCDPHHIRGPQIGMGQKSSDRDVVPIHRRCHDDWHDARGFCAGWSKTERHAWERRTVEPYREIFDFPVVLLVRRLNPLRWAIFGAYATDEEAERVWESSIRGRGVSAWSWWGPRDVAAKMVSDPHYQPEVESA